MRTPAGFLEVGDGGTERPAELRVAACLAGLALLAGRYGAGGPMLVAAPPLKTVPPDSAPLFFHLARAEDMPAGSYLREVMAELLRAEERHAYSLPAVLARLKLEAAEDLYRDIGIGFLHTGLMHDFPDLSHFTLVFELRETGGAVRLLIHYDPELAAAEAVEQLGAHYLRAVAFLMESPAAELAGFELLHEAERRQILDGFNDTAVPRSEHLSLHGLFERQAELHPEAAAVVCERERLTYGEVNRLANQLAHYLRGQLAVQASQPVALMVPRSAQMIIGILAILKAGASYVPIDPAYPPDVVMDTLEDCGARVLLLSSGSLQKAARFDGDLFFVDLQLANLTEPVENPGVELDGAAAAYVIYTSGSTGKRKGVVVEHRSIVNTVLWRNELYGFGAGSTVLQIPSYTFDSSVEDIFCMLTSGGALVIPTEAQRADTRTLRLLIQEHAVTSLIITPSFHRAFLLEIETSRPPREGLSSLKVVTIAGEETTPDLVRRHYRCLPEAALINEYGPTENAVCATVCALNENDSRVPIGTPIDNVAVYVLDARMRVLPKGARGELFLAGPGLARGYLNRPDLTAERFVPNPVSPQRSARLYRTGDLARWGLDGKLEFMGRADNQVKVRGFRVELGEIEAVLRSHPLMADVAVVCRENECKEKHLAAYLVGPQAADLPEIRRYLSQALPPFMVPELWRALAELPVTVHGKVDRNKLAAQEIGGGAAQAQAAAGMTPVETSVLGILADTLANREIGIEHDFFEQGGNSLSVLAVIAKVRDELKVELAASDVYTYSTGRKLAAKIEKDLVRR
ncbi:MAG TPA: non-ribosomal peptide synthetase [Thermoanaerobaculia bacterium]|nr:non-ribosomal peptide synthetase [Thermoanaerobaculia bacterium]